MTIRIALCVIAALVACLPAEANARTVLTSSLTLFFNPASGDDTAGDGSATKPFKSPCGAYNNPTNGLVTKYDLNGQNVTVQAQAPGEFFCSLTIVGKLIGQTGSPGQVHIIGDQTKDHLLYTPLYKWSAPPYETALCVCYGAAAMVTGFKFDNWHALNGPGSGPKSSRIMVLVGGPFSVLWLENPVFGYEANDISAYVNAQNFAALQIFGNIGFEGGGWTSCAFGIGEQAQFIVPTDSNGINYVSIRGNPRFDYGFICLDDLSWGHWVGSYFFNADTITTGVTADGTAGQKHIIVSNPTVVGLGYKVLAPQIPFETKVIAITGDIITLDKPLTASMNDSPVRFGWAPAQITGATFNLQHGARMVTGGTYGSFPGTVAVIDTSSGLN